MHLCIERVRFGAQRSALAQCRQDIAEAGQLLNAGASMSFAGLPNPQRYPQECEGCYHKECICQVCPLISACPSNSASIAESPSESALLHAVVCEPLGRLHIEVALLWI